MYSFSYHFLQIEMDASLAPPKHLMNSEHSLEKIGLFWMKCSNKTLKNLPYFWITKTHVFLVFQKVR